MNAVRASGAVALLAGAIRYALGACALVTPGELTLPTPCAQWDLGTLLGHLGDSMTDLEVAFRTGHLAVSPGPPAPAGQRAEVLGEVCGQRAEVSGERAEVSGERAEVSGQRAEVSGERAEVSGERAEVLRERAAELLCAVYDFGAAGQFVVVGGLPMPGGLVACAGAVEIAVHGWDVAAARGGDCPIPAELARRLLRLCPFLAAGREDLFARPVPVPVQAGPCDQLVGSLGRDPALAWRRPVHR
jgi:uncharacterized protein (TIGR03086 family)